MERRPLRRCAGRSRRHISRSSLCLCPAGTRSSIRSSLSRRCWRSARLARMPRLSRGKRRRACRRRQRSTPKVPEAIGRHFGVPDRVLDVLVPEIVLQGARVVAIVSELKTAGMAQHVWVDREWHLGSLADALDKTVETDGADWPAALGNEHISLSRVIAPELAKRPHLVTADRMHAENAVLDAVNVQAALG